MAVALALTNVYSFTEHCNQSGLKVNVINLRHFTENQLSGKLRQTLKATIGVIISQEIYFISKKMEGSQAAVVWLTEMKQYKLEKSNNPSQEDDGTLKPDDMKEDGY